MFTDRGQTDTAEPSYFNFLMEMSDLHRAHVPLAQAAGVLPELACAMRVRASGARATNAVRMMRGI